MKHHVTPEKDRVPLRERVGLGLGSLASAGSYGTLGVLVNPVFNIILGVNPAVLSTILFVQRLWDAFTDPLVGQYSDNFRSRWGRRKPLLAVGAPLIATFFVAMWWFPVGSSPNAIAVAFLITSLFYVTSFTLYTMPLAGLTIEATTDYHERTRIAALVAVFGFAFSIFSQFIMPLANNTNLFPNTLTGVRWITGICAMAFLAAALMPVLLCREHNYALASHQRRLKLIPSLRSAFTSRPFRILLCMRVIVSFCYNTVSQLALYMNIYYVFNGDKTPAFKAFAWIGSTFHVVAILGSTLVYPFLSRVIGKRATIQCAAGALIVGCTCKMFLYRAGEPWWQLIIVGFNGLALSGMSLISTSMLGDIADYDELQNGTRRESLFASLVAWVDKAGVSLGGLVSGYLLVLWGFDAKIGAQSPMTLQLMKWSYVTMPLLGAIVAIMLMRRYTISEEQAYSIKDELARRHTQAGGSAKFCASADHNLQGPPP